MQEDLEREIDEAVEAAPILTTDQIMAAQDIEEKTVFVKPWGGNVRLRSLTKAQQQRIRLKARRRDNTFDQEKIEMLLLIEGIVEPKMTEQHFAMLRTKNAGVLDMLLKEIGEMSGVTAEALTAQEAVDEAEAAFREES